MSFCYGLEKECIVDEESGATTIQTVITGCSDQNPLFSFDAGQAFLEAIGAAGTNIADVGWPKYLSDDFIAIAPTTQAMSLFFILGTGMVGLSVMFRLATIRYIWQPRPPVPPTSLEPPPDYPGFPRFPGLPGYPGYPGSSLPDPPPPSTPKLLIAVTSCVFLTTGSIIASLISSQFVALLNRSGNPTISAGSSSNFLGMAWAATVIQIILTIDILVAILRYRARHCRCDWEELPGEPGVEK
ncbi:actin cortical patch SUR7/pH-response regulator pali [Penicillium nucicola]|uniref:actin cortical patch SUR7/pH-response regulator pali n=1 Tax=Penicillium nucicola TaxID=1850975 RepID=UPI002544F430|nr:actin cortical patch SUR7/pH-response regulator pali [Penicillium nucicola]KAJ5748381.1 actin cortical patch SUR7/pH-response regulator pali [Penicillium nucicola]